MSVNDMRNSPQGIPLLLSNGGGAAHRNDVNFKLISSRVNRGG